ncbi:MAG: phospho-N-acetylmuramoyl-pentapeptide-transferase [Candidatus Hydrogenedentes bacterium]|nr:phospho-N-acetylmuramoyl-pentapeptide-transferase [Candidatus Hydrogenedentota bacterium]
MLYYLGLFIEPKISAFNVLTYYPVRTGGAAVTAFLVSLIIGPTVIRLLRSLKIGQYIKKEHVADLHALHKNKAGTPTMGGALIVLAALIALVLWGRFENRLLLLALATVILLGAVGFLDDFVKLRRKHNQGLSAKAKFLGQIVVGIFLGVYLTYNPIAYSATYVALDDVDWDKFIPALQQNVTSPDTAAKRCVAMLPESKRAIVDAAPRGGPWSGDTRRDVLAGFRDLIDDRRLYDADLWSNANLSDEALDFAAAGVAALSDRELRRFNRLLIETAFPDIVETSVPDIHTKVEVPFLKMVLIPFGILYVLFVLTIIVGASNAVNLTDGLDGLAIGASIISLLTYTGIAYVISRANWSEYLLLIYVPEASELTVFGGAMLGAGLGFLWFNCHPAEVFMGDTGSLALGGALGAMAILTKQELLLVIVGGLFVIEASSVMIQVASFKTRGKRVFRMAPLHHHFELLGWNETKVVTRFLIVALIFALMSLATLKFR